MQKFNLTDADGDVHEYACQPHPAGEGTRLVVEVMSLAAEPIGRLLESKLTDLIEQFQTGEITLDDEIGELAGELQTVEWSKVAGDLRRVIAETNSPQLIAEILKYTKRDGQPLANSGVYDTAYQQNYLEMLKAVAKVVQINGFLGFIVSSGDV